jgi:hypothetical protein
MQSEGESSERDHSFLDKSRCVSGPAGYYCRHRNVGLGVTAELPH